MSFRHRGVAALVAALAFGQAVQAQPRVDNVLVKMVPPATSILLGARMDQIRQTALYRKMMATQSLGQVDEFTRETGFDPRRDVRELLYATTPTGSVILARGNFKLKPQGFKSLKAVRRGEYVIYMSGPDAGFCILDPTLAVAGTVNAVGQALDEWKSGKHVSAQPFLSRLGGVSPQAQFWGISTGASNFLADHPPMMNSGIDFGQIFKGLRDTWFQADLAAGLNVEVHGTTATDKDAQQLKDAVRGVVGLGRLNVPEDRPELLRVWDGVTVDQVNRAITVKAEIPQELVDRMVDMVNSVPRGGVGRRLLQ